VNHSWLNYEPTSSSRLGLGLFSLFQIGRSFRPTLFVTDECNGSDGDATNNKLNCTPNGPRLVVVVDARGLLYKRGREEEVDTPTMSRPIASRSLVIN
jgi:hypothetical protein